MAPLARRRRFGLRADRADHVRAIIFQGIGQHGRHDEFVFHHQHAAARQGKAGQSFGFLIWFGKLWIGDDCRHARGLNAPPAGRSAPPRHHGA
jgi:hypothetical protein